MVSGPVPVPVLLLRLQSELGALLEQLQLVEAAAVALANHTASRSAQPVFDLQRIDHAMQVTDALQGLVGEMASRAGQGWTIDIADYLSQITLGGVAARLAGQDSPQATDAGAAGYELL